MNSLQGFIVRNPNGIVFASFADRGLAVVFCHAQGYPEKWIESAEIIIKPVGVENFQPLHTKIQELDNYEF